MSVVPADKVSSPREVASGSEPEGFDRIFPYIGGNHRYQWLLLAIISLAGTNAFHHLGYTFLGATPNHWCKVDALEKSLSEFGLDWSEEQIRNISIPKYATLKGYEQFDQCSYYDLDYAELIRWEPNFEKVYAKVDFRHAETKSCSEWVYDTSIYQTTVVTEFNLVCGRKHLAAAIQGTYMAGVFVGSLFQGALSDQLLGRRGCILLSSVLIIVGGFGAWLMTSYLGFILFRFMIAIGAAGLFQNKLTVLMEYCDNSSRAAFGFLTWTPYCIVYTFMALYGYLLRDWRDLQLAFSVSTLVLISYFWIMPESSRWLISKDRDEEAIKILEGIAKFNRLPPPPREEVVDILKSCKEKVDDQNKNSSGDSFIRRAYTGFKRFCGNYANLVKTPELRKRTLILWVLFISVALVYYGIAFASPTLSSNPYIIVFWGGVVEFPGYLGAIPLAKWGRKPAAALTFLVSGFACAAVSFVPEDITWLRVFFSLVGKMFITGTFSVVYLLATELYPTTERATGVAAAALMGRFGSISAPYIALMKSTYSDLPTVVFAISALLAGLVALLLPETKNAEMLEHVNAVEKAAVAAAAVTARTRSASQDQDGIKKDSIQLNELHNKLA